MLNEPEGIVLDTLVQLGVGGAFDANEFDPESIRELQALGFVRRHAQGRIGISQAGRDYLADLKAELGSLPPPPKSRGLIVVQQPRPEHLHANGGGVRARSSALMPRWMRSESRALSTARRCYWKPASKCCSMPVAARS